MATAGSNAFDSLRGWVTQNSGTTNPVNGISQSAEDLLRRPAQPFANPAANPVTPNMPEYHGDGRYGATPNGAPNGGTPAPSPTALRTTVGNAYRNAVGRPPVGPQPNTISGRLTNSIGNGALPAIGGAITQAIDENDSLRDTKDDFNAGKITGLDAGASGSESVARIASAGAGAGIGYNVGTAAGATLGAMTGLLAPIAVPTLGFLGGAGGAYLGSKVGPMLADTAISAGRDLTGSSPTNTAAPATTAATTAVPQGTKAGGNGVRGSGFDDPRLVNQNPARASLGASRDFTAELNKLPANLPSDLREGVIHKTVDPATGRVTYSGRNVAAGADGTTQMVDGMGKNLQSGGSVRTAVGPVSLGPNGSYVASTDKVDPAAKQAAVDQILTGPRGTKMSPQDVAVMAANQRDGVDLYRGTSQDAGLRRGGGQGGGMDNSIDGLMERASAPLGTPGRSAARAALTQQMANDGSLRVAQMQQDTTLLGKKWDLQVAQAQRSAIAQASKMAGNDPAKVAELLSNAGYVDAAKHFSDMANQALTRETSAQALKTGAASAADKLFEHQAVGVNKDGEGYIDPAKAAISRNVRDNIAPDFSNLPADQQIAMMPKLDAGANIVNGANTLRSNNFLQSIGWDPQSPAMTTLPDLRKAKVGEVGRFKGMIKGGGVSRGDYEVQMPDGTTHYLPRASVGQNEIELMKAQGAKFNDKK